MGKSAAIMKSMNSLIRAPEVMDAMRRMSEEMQKAGIIEEMLGELIQSCFCCALSEPFVRRLRLSVPATVQNPHQDCCGRLASALALCISTSRAGLAFRSLPMQATQWMLQRPRVSTRRLMR